MNYYIDIKLKRVARQSVLMNELVHRLHLALVKTGLNSIGVSYPNYGVTLGDTLRIHGTKADLERLQSVKWANDSATDIQPVPEHSKHAIFSRVRSNLSTSKLRRLAKRKQLSQQDKKEYKIKMLQSGLDLPFLELRSGSTGKIYQQHISVCNVDCEQCGTFDTFGLSKNASVPIF